MQSLYLGKEKAPSQFIVKFNLKLIFDVFRTLSSLSNLKLRIPEVQRGRPEYYKHLNFIFVIFSEIFDCILLLCHK